MSEYNVNVRHEEGCGESINGDDNEDLLDDLNNSDDNEVKLIKLSKVYLIDWWLLLFSRRKIVDLFMLVFVHNGKKSKPNQWRKFSIVWNNLNFFV